MVVPNKLFRKIKKADQIVRNTWASGLTGLEFSYGKNSTGYTGIDPITGLALGGFYVYDKKGTVYLTGFATPQNGAIPSVAVNTILLKGNKRAFADYSYAFASNPPALNDAIYTAYLTGDGYPLALANETLPGVQNPGSPTSFVTVNGVEFSA